MKASAPKLWLSLVFLLALALAAQAEFRGAWISSVHNLDWPSKKGLPAAQQKAELVRLLDSAKSLGLTDVFFQVRPEGDALYRSSLEPWSRFLTGTQGKDPGYDPLAFCISEAGKRGIRVHAWFNPYRASVKAGNPLAKNPLQDVRVRRALSMAINRDALRDRVMEGLAEPCIVGTGECRAGALSSCPIHNPNNS